MKPLSPLRAFCLQPVTLSATDTPRLEPRLRSILAAGANRRTDKATRFVALAATVGLAVCAGVVRPVAPDARAVPPAIAESKWVKTADGVAVELVAVYNHANKNEIMWRPDGTPLPKSAYIKHFVSTNDDLKTHRSLAYFLSVHDADATPEVATQNKELPRYSASHKEISFLLPSDIKNRETGKQKSAVPFREAWSRRFGCGRIRPTNSYYSSISEYVDCSNGNEMFVKDDFDLAMPYVYGVYKRGTENGTLRMAIAAGPWTNSEEWQNPNNGIERHITAKRQYIRKIGDPHQFFRFFQIAAEDEIKSYGGSFHVFTRDTNPELDSRVIAVDRKGVEHLPWHSREGSDGKQRMSTYTFPELTINDVQTLRRQTRPFRTVTFTDIPLAPRK